MARKPRPIDPAEGPLQAFAHDLRTVREEAGNPTYRALAALAGFGASTLSDAAGGMRQPSLEVTLAYVGACGGDIRLWQRRWEELNRTLAAQRAELRPDGTGGADGTGGSGADGTDQATAPVDGTPDGPSAEQDVEQVRISVDELHGRPADRRRWSRRSGLVAVAAAVAVSCGLLGAQLHPSGKAVHAPSPCAIATAVPSPGTVSAAGPSGTSTDPAAVATAATPGPATPAPVLFTGMSYGSGAHVRAGASLNASLLRTVPAGCPLPFVGYCVGDVVHDATGGSDDMRWFELQGGGVVASAVVHGNPPSSLAPTRCADDVPMPTSIALTITQQGPDGNTVDLTATGPNLGIVGFAAYFAAGGTETKPIWHSLGMNSSVVTGFASLWRLGPLWPGPAAPSSTAGPGEPSGPAGPGTPPGTPPATPPATDPAASGPPPAGPQAAQAPITVVAPACLGGSGPTGTVDARLLPPPGAPAQPAELDPQQLATAAQAACQYPGPNRS
ncbi:hypothetical protein GCM10009665_38910 [Kitasatospora nipponensis]|uniref:Helix-turn-helix protein n=1 Tax=Kitasatospora nipponensis TaxID=258049 RepID=A0ABN1WBN0_9ACTN